MEYHILHIYVENLGSCSSIGSSGANKDSPEMIEPTVVLGKPPVDGKIHCISYDMLYTLRTIHTYQNLVSVVVDAMCLVDLHMPGSRWPRQRKIPKSVLGSRQFW